MQHNVSASHLRYYQINMHLYPTNDDPPFQMLLSKFCMEFQRGPLLFDLLKQDIQPDKWFNH